MNPHRPDEVLAGLTDAQKAAYEAEGRRPHWRFKLEGKRVAWEDLARGHAEVQRLLTLMGIPWVVVRRPTHPGAV